MTSTNRAAAGGWFRVRASGWPAIADMLTASGQPWPTDAVEADLEWWADGERVGRGKRPGRPSLRRRWGWTDHAVRTMLREWHAEPAVASRPPAGRQPTASGPPADRQPTASAETVETAESVGIRQRAASRPPADRQDSASGPPVRLLTRVGDRRQTQTQTQTSDKNTSPAGRRSSVFPTDVSWSAVTTAYDAFRAASGVGPSSRALTRSKGVGKELVRCCRAHDEGPEGVVALFGWLATSSHSRAQWYRQQRLQATNVRRHLAELVAASEEPEPSRAVRGEHRSERRDDRRCQPPARESPRSSSDRKPKNPAKQEDIPW